MTRLIQSPSPNGTQAFDLSDRGLLLADGVFDTSYVRNGTMFLKEAHITRLLSDAAALDISVSRPDLEALIEDALKDADTGVLRLTITRGPGGRGLVGNGPSTPTLMARLTPYDTARQFASLSLQTSSIRRNSSSLTARHKTLAYTDNVMAARRAVANGFDEALFLNTEGRLACTASANVFIRQRNTLITPPVRDGTLPGTLRAWVLEQAGQAGLKAEEQSVSVEDLKAADQIFLTNSLRLIAPVSNLDGADQDPTPIAALNDLLRSAIETECGR